MAEQQGRGVVAAALTAVVALVVAVRLCAADVDAAAMLQQSPWLLHVLGLQQVLRRVCWVVQCSVVVVVVAVGPRPQGLAPTFDCASPAARQLKQWRQRGVNDWCS